ncbi:MULTISPECIES: DUF397 domain-containing protein [Microbispora]|uniref:DUF397 domain-containing protein n=1 Tax=Microbispora TaxID=2005 RepID=UPI0028A88B93|nr:MULTISPECIES: DUF397 domain-containing protein [Microbispora]
MALSPLLRNSRSGGWMAGRPTFSDATWRRACGGGNCVEVAFQDGRVGVRDGKQGDDSPVLAFTAEEWRAFLQEAKTGAFDPS